MRTCDNESRQPPLVAQKKHHMFGKRCLQVIIVKYSLIILSLMFAY